MAGGWPTGLIAANASDMGTVTSGSTGTLVPGGSTQYAKGAWTQIITSTPHDMTCLLVSVNTLLAWGTGIGFDLAVGPSGSEVAFISNVVLTGGTYGTGASVMLTTSIPAGTRISARMASIAGGDNGINLQIIGFDSGYLGASVSAYDTYGWAGTVTAPAGVLIDASGGAADAKSAYAQITASTAHDLSGFILGFDTQNYLPTPGGGASDNQTILVDVAVGASGSENVIVPNLSIAKVYNDDGTNQVASLLPQFTPLIPLPIPAGSRIAARAQSSAPSSPDSLFGVSLYGLRT